MNFVRWAFDAWGGRLMAVCGLPRNAAFSATLGLWLAIAGCGSPASDPPLRDTRPITGPDDTPHEPRSPAEIEVRRVPVELRSTVATYRVGRSRSDGVVSPVQTPTPLDSDREEEQQPAVEWVMNLLHERDCDPSCHVDGTQFAPAFEEVTFGSGGARVQRDRLLIRDPTGGESMAELTRLFAISDRHRIADVSLFHDAIHERLVVAALVRRGGRLHLHVATRALDVGPREWHALAAELPPATPDSLRFSGLAVRRGYPVLVLEVPGETDRPPAKEAVWLAGPAGEAEGAKTPLMASGKMAWIEMMPSGAQPRGE